jgi:flagellar motor switch protein FliN/FliY
MPEDMTFEPLPEQPPAGDTVPTRPGDAPPLPDLERLGGVSVELTVEVGRTRMSLSETLALGPGSVVTLDRLSDQPVDLLVNGRPIARGEVVVIDEEFGLRITEVVGAAPPARTAGAAAVDAPGDTGLSAAA